MELAAHCDEGCSALRFSTKNNGQTKARDYSGQNIRPGRREQSAVGIFPKGSERWEIQRKIMPEHSLHFLLCHKNGDCKSQDNYPDTQDQSTHAYPGIAPSSKKPFPILFCYSKETSGTRYTKGSDLHQSLRCKFSQTALMEDGKGWADSFCTPPSCLSPWRVSTWAWIQ